LLRLTEARSGARVCDPQQRQPFGIWKLLSRTTPRTSRCEFPSLSASGGRGPGWGGFSRRRAILPLAACPSSRCAAERGTDGAARRPCHQFRCVCSATCPPRRVSSPAGRRSWVELADATDGHGFHLIAWPDTLPW